jgi:hypothetical protein
MQRVMKRLVFLVLLLVVTLSAHDAAATLAPMLESSYHDGFVFYGFEPGYEGYLKGRIDFAVYDTEHPEYGDEYLDAGITPPGEGRYIYAYQIFNDYDVSEESVAYFALLGVVEATVDGIGSQEDPETGIAPSKEYLAGAESRAVWEFNGGAGYIIAGEHSWFLVLGSEQDWVKGDYEIRGPQEIPVPLPEPATIALLGLGGAVIVVRRRRSV